VVIETINGVDEEASLRGNYGLIKLQHSDSPLAIF